MESARSVLETFTLESLPDLDVVMEGALELFSELSVPEVDLQQFKRPLVVGSGNAAVTGQVLFDTVDAIFADESNYIQKLDTIEAIDGAFLISASGAKHAVEIVKELTRRSLPTVLLTNNAEAPAKEFLPESSVLVFPKNREPYTYNTSTYLGMILSKTHEDPSRISTFIKEQVLPVIPQNFTSYQAFYFLVPEKFNSMRGMFQTKFDELFGPRVMARIFTPEQTKHAKTVILLDTELFVSFGVANEQFGAKENRVHIPLPENAGYGAMMAVAYTFIGHMQRQFPPFYKERIAQYAEETSQLFGTTINPIVE